MAVKEISSNDFETLVLQSSFKQPVVVDFWAPWCGPCRMITPIIEELDTEYAGKIEFRKVNIDENADIASRFEVMSIPTLILFKDGQPVEKIVGTTSKALLKRRFDENIEE